MPYTAQTLTIKVDMRNPDSQTIALAAQVICRGGLVAFPTETVYGLGADATSAEAAARIFEAKQRPANDPLIVHIQEKAQLEQVAREIPDNAYKLAAAFWPGALTFVLKKNPAIPDTVTAGNDTVAVRLPDHPVARALIDKAGVPIAAPSANRFSRPSPTTAAHVLADLDGHVDIILDGGSTLIGLESTILDLTAPVPTVLRPGGVSLEALREYLPGVAYRPQHILEGETAPAPGTLLKHYSPHAQVMLYEGDPENVYPAMCSQAHASVADGRQVGILARDDEIAYFSGIDARIILIGTTPETMAAALFAGMRDLDQAQVDDILVRAPQKDGLGLALYDRLLRAAEGHVIAVQTE